ncbi:methyl-accepting chemotaxis protein [Pelomonas sp. CA6]|uniref:methyl-accepting chemotaxis protein n=1 Tax=Pelomonas sp. CA6 TaxID=2907999 RepID=UPI001F4A3840|nr:methyl-accepting chemotaxis protein [Pelomonas sp. CA6]MCH7342569.1 methyl-accepting chemotaxis protein [Pelomonas sp. CA6]
MLSLRKMKVATLLALGNGLLWLLMALMGAAAWQQLDHIDAQFQLALADRYPRVKLLHELKNANNQVARLVRDQLIWPDADAVRDKAQQIAEVSRTTTATLTELEKLLDSPEGRADLERLAVVRKAYHSERQVFTRMVEQGQTDAARQQLSERMLPRHLAYMGEVDRQVKQGEQLMQEAARDAAAAAASARQRVLLLLGAATLAALALSVWLQRLITRPLNDAVAVANRVAQGDLTRPVEVSEADNETGRLLKALQHMQQRLAGMVREVRLNAEGVASASAQIATGNSDLSSRTEQQAAALQQTAASMDQLGATVRGNDQHAQQADTLAREAARIADEGGSAVGEVVRTMREISASSHKVADIIGVIDAIAFQTNILALNAAVEAARAGEQGRGFAVVASEVRQLAQRSAEAAKEIKGLIGSSNDRVEQGCAQVDRAGMTIQQVGQAIARVAALMAEISHASREQSAGVQQVGLAVTQMDRSTQENAALVEESAAAAESLHEQARRLLGTVAQFRVAG